MNFKERLMEWFKKNEGHPVTPRFVMEGASIMIADEIENLHRLQKMKIDQGIMDKQEVPLNTCKTCKFRVDEHCTNSKLSENYYPKDDEKIDMLVYSYFEGGTFFVGENFGCVHHQKNENN